MKTALIHDWLVTDAGAEKVLRGILECYPDAEIFSLVDFLDDEARQNVLLGKHAHTSFIQHLPFARTHFRYYLPLFPMAIESFNLDRFDLIISSSWAVAKGVKKAPHALHVSYCHTPIRYAWDLYDEYTQNLAQPKKWLVEHTLRGIRAWDRKSADRVDCFIANSTIVQERIRRHYGREATVIHPPVETKAFTCKADKEDFYLTVSRLVPYKKVRMIVEAFNQNGRPLVVIGDGEEYAAIQRIARSNIRILGHQSQAVIIDYMQRARAFVYAALEDFGIVVVEAMSCGTPVIAYGVGGVRDSVIDGKSGLFFTSQTPASLNEAVDRFERLHFDATTISTHAFRFDRAQFKRSLMQVIHPLYLGG